MVVTRRRASRGFANRRFAEIRDLSVPLREGSGLGRGGAANGIATKTVRKSLGCNRGGIGIVTGTLRQHYLQRRRSVRTTGTDGAWWC